jgi:hypothetical protein
MRSKNRVENMRRVPWLRDYASHRTPESSLQVLYLYYNIAIIVSMLYIL